MNAYDLNKKTKPEYDEKFEPKRALSIMISFLSCYVDICVWLINYKNNPLFW